MSKTITQLPPAASVNPNAVVAADNAAATATEKVTLGQIVALAAVQSVNGKVGTVGITAVDVGLGSVNNTADADKPISTATQAALDGKAASTHGHGAATSVAAGFMSAADKNKLDGVASNATANQSDTFLLNRANHTGTQLAATISGLVPLATSGNAGDLSAGTVPVARLPLATNATAGAIIVGAGLNVSAGTVSAAVISVNGQTGVVTIPSYSLPVATAATLGGVRQGNNINIDGTGVISAFNNATYTVSQQSPATSLNDFNPGSGAVVRLTPSAAINITGLVAGTDGQMRIIYNAGGSNVSLLHNSTSSTAGNRFFLYNSASSYVLLPNCGVTVVYDATSQVWRVF